jgi:hypothetical protein
VWRFVGTDRTFTVRLVVVVHAELRFVLNRTLRRKCPDRDPQCGGVHELIQQFADGGGNNAWARLWLVHQRHTGIASRKIACIARLFIMVRAHTQHAGSCCDQQHDTGDD